MDVDTSMNPHTQDFGSNAGNVADYGRSTVDASKTTKTGKAALDQIKTKMLPGIQTWIKTANDQGKSQKERIQALRSVQTWIGGAKGEVNKLHDNVSEADLAGVRAQLTGFASQVVGTYRELYAAMKPERGDKTADLDLLAQLTSNYSGIKDAEAALLTTLKSVANTVMTKEEAKGLNSNKDWKSEMDNRD